MSSSTEAPRPIHSKQTTVLIVDAERTEALTVNTTLLRYARPALWAMVIGLLSAFLIILYFLWQSFHWRQQVEAAKAEQQQAEKSAAMMAEEVDDLKNMTSQAVQEKLEGLRESERSVAAIQQYLQERGVTPPSVNPEPARPAAPAKAPISSTASPTSTDKSALPLQPDQGGVAIALANPIAFTGHYAEQVKSLQDVLRQVPIGRPHTGELSSRFGPRANPFGTGQSEFHNGLDFRGQVGEPIVATADGTVSVAGEQSGYGLVVKINHGYGYSTVYGHLSAISVQAGQSVKAGQEIGKLGSTGRSTGPHLHYEVRYHDAPKDPEDYLSL